MFKRLILYLESRLKFRAFNLEVEQETTESVMLTSDEMYNVLLSVEGVDEELADRIVERLQDLMGVEEDDAG